MTETYVQAQMDVVEFPDVDIIATSEAATYSYPDYATDPQLTSTPYYPGDSFLE